MGMRHSGAVSDACLLARAEPELLAKRRELGMQCYIRFRDDLFAAVKRPSMGPLFIDALSKLAAPIYIIERESFSLVRVNMLDMNI